ncbi:MAG: AAC(3) family N-acetyltransferase [Candidatus Latescibacterota bacterium]
MGLCAGDTVFVHASLRSFGQVQDGAAGVVRALLQVLGPDGTLAVPAQAQGPVPAVLCLHGTGGSLERMMEPECAPQGSHLLGWARALARRGLGVLAITQLSHPPRREPWDWEWPKRLLPYGQTAMGLLVADVVFCVDYLCHRPEVDARRIGVAGFSLGGNAAGRCGGLRPGRPAGLRCPRCSVGLRAAPGESGGHAMTPAAFGAAAGWLQQALQPPTGTRGEGCRCHANPS